MFCEVDHVHKAQLSSFIDTRIKLAENRQFTCTPSKDATWYRIKDVIGNFEIKSVTITFSDNTEWKDVYDKSKSRFRSYGAHCYTRCNATFYITSKIECQEMKENVRTIEYQLPISSYRLQSIQPYFFVRSEFVLPGYDDFKFTYYINKIHESKVDDIQIHIENPFEGVKIQGKNGDFVITQSSANDVNLLLSFSIYPLHFSNTKNTTSLINGKESALFEGPEITQFPPPDESRPESVIPSFIPSLKLQKLAFDDRFADVHFITSDGTEIPSHCCILAQFSEMLAKIFEESAEIPVEINVDDFGAETIHSALSFIYDQPDAINGKEMNVFKFALHYGINNLIDACFTIFEETVDPSNVCEYVQIAYSNNCDRLKQKCLKFLFENRKEIGSSKVAQLSKEILADVFCF